MVAATYDDLLLIIADYVFSPQSPSQLALDNARLCMLDALGCLAAAADAPDIQPILGPVVPGTTVPLGCRVPGTSHVLDPIRAAFNTSALIRWLDFSDTTFRGGHPSDSIGAVLACADYVSRREASSIAAPLSMRHVFEAMVRTYEIQGVIADSVKFDTPQLGLDAVLAVKLACAAVCSRMLGGTREHAVHALSNAFLDGGTLNAYRHPPNSGTRKGWAGADAASRGVGFAMMALAGEMGYAQPLTAAPWGFYEVLLDGRPIQLQRALGCGVMENVIFKLIPCQRNGTTAVEAALQLHPVVTPRLDEVRRIMIFTHAEAIERIDKKGPLPNPAARDHCLQFMVAAALAFGELRSEHYRAPLALDSRIERLRARTCVVEDVRYTRDYSDPATLSCANAVQAEFDDGSFTPRVEVAYPAGDPSRRAEALPNVRRKFMALTQGRWSDSRRESLLTLFSAPSRLDALRVRDFAALLTGE
jgi:2-methylcitrate dehydratase